MTAEPILRPATRDYFAEMYVAGVLADDGWNLYFPHRDVGFDMIATRRLDDGATLIRPVQVKGKYASDEKTRKAKYGYVGRLTALHADMILAIPYFTSLTVEAPCLIAWMPRGEIKSATRGFACQPAKFTSHGPEMRLGFWHYFGRPGMARMARPDNALI